MQVQKQNFIVSALILAGSLLATNAIAQQKISGSSMKQTAGGPVPMHSYSLKTTKGKITVTDGTRETVISQDPHDVQPVMNGNEVYYINKAEAGASIYVYDISGKAKEDIIKQQAETAHYNTHNDIENIIIDNKSNRMFFSAALANARGHVEKQTWKYDLNTKQLEVYKDGAIESIDEASNQVIVFNGVDAKGTYTMRSIIDKGGKLQSVLGKQYDLISTK
jgi:hypothetical protein